MSKRKNNRAIGKQSSRLHQTINGLVLASVLVVSPSAMADGDARAKRNYQISSGTLSHALSQFAGSAGILLSVDARLTDGKSSKGLEGEYTVEEGFQKLLAGTGLVHVFSGGNTVTLKVLEKSDADTLSVVTVVDQVDDKEYAVYSSSTALKTDTPLMQTPASIQVIPKTVLHDQQAYRLEDVLKNVSGVQSYHAYGGDHENYVMRGFLQSTVNYRNGIRIPFTKFDLANIDRVEVLKGASAMMYGFGDPGGMITTVTKQPSSTPHYSLEQRFGSFDFYRTEASATGPLSKKNGLNYRMDFSYLDRGSFRQYMGNDRIFFAPTVSWDATPDTKLTFAYEHYEDNNAYDYGTPAIGNQLARIPISRTLTGVVGERNHTNNNLYDFRIDHRINNNIKLNAGAVASQYDKYWNNVYLATVNQTPGANFGNVGRRQWLGPEKGNTLTSWINGTFDFETYGVKHKFLLGTEYYSSDVNYQVSSGNTIDTINIFNPNIAPISDATLNQFRNLSPNSIVATDSTTKALYLQDQLTFWNSLHIMGGFRYDWVERDQSLSWWATPAAPTAGIDSRTDDFVSPRAGILYEASDWLSLFGNFSESFGPASDYDNGGQKLYDLFTATQFEGGVKTQFFDGKLNASVAYFDLERTQFFQDPNSDLINMSIPVKGKSKGVEFDMQGQIYEGLSLIGTYAYTDAKITNDLTAPANVGHRLPYAPTHQGSAWLKYDFNNDILKGFTLGAGVYLSGRRYGDAANSYYDRAYTRLDLMAGYKRKLGAVNLTTQVNINNVNDAEYYVLRSRRTNLPAEPLSVMGSVKLEY